MLKTPIPHGFLIAVEGIDGAGKTSLAALLAQWCGERGLACVLSKEPTSLKWGQELRASAKAGRLTLERELELFELDRRQHVANTIAPALESGSIVILDRYYWSTAAYQGARGADPAQIMATNESFAPQADLVIILDSEVDVGLHRIRARGDKPNEFESKPALQKSRDIFRQISDNHPAAFVIDSSGYLKESFDTALHEFLRRAEIKINAANLADSTQRIAQLHQS